VASSVVKRRKKWRTPNGWGSRGGDKVEGQQDSGRGGYGCPRYHSSRRGFTCMPHARSGGRAYCTKLRGGRTGRRNKKRNIIKKNCSEGRKRKRGGDHLCVISKGGTHPSRRGDSNTRITKTNYGGSHTHERVDKQTKTHQQPDTHHHQQKTQRRETRKT